MQKKATAPASAEPAPKAAKTPPAKATPPRSAPAKATGAAGAPGPVGAKAARAKSVPGEAAGTGTVTGSPAAQPVKEVSRTVVKKAEPVVTKKAEPVVTKKAEPVVTKKAEPVVTKKAAAAPKSKVKGDRAAFFVKQRELLIEERSSYMSSAEVLKAQADSLALEHEPGDVQFDEEGGEGGTANVDREIDLYLSGQARATVVEIDRALQKIEDGTYGTCEQCGQTIPDARLQALPYAALCVSCKSGGLSSRR
jgi:DnaK suppressor protein